MKRRQLFRLLLASPAAWLVGKYGLPANVDHELHIPMPSGVLPGDHLVAFVAFQHEGKLHRKTMHAIVRPDGAIYPQFDLVLPGLVPAVGALYAVRESVEDVTITVPSVRIALAEAKP